MPDTTTNYGLKKPRPNEYYDIAVQNENMDAIDTVLAEKLDKAGAGSDVTVAFTQASSRTNVASGEKLSILFGKIRKWFADLKAVAFSGSYNDLTDKPAIPSALADLSEDSAHRTVTDAEKAAWNAKSTLTLGETSATAYRGDRGKIAYDHSQAAGNPHGTTPADIGAVPTTRKVNGKALSSDINLTASDVGAVPTTRTINGKALSTDITLSATDVGAAASTHTHSNLSVNGKALAGAISLSASDVGAVPTSAEGTTYCGIDANNSGKIKPERATAAIRSITSNTTLSLDQAGCLLQVNSSSAITVTIPSNSSVAFATGTEIEILRYGTGSVTIAAASGVSIICAEATYTISDQYKSVCLKKLATNTWLLQGAVG